ncbi:MAG TPA: DUF222 domain-containing protein, partial [Nocardioidaceae bacterium]|nr:DUF222 domain-containing protein [Nocardioidaceae bacterium]
MAAVQAFEGPVTPAGVIGESFAVLDELEAELWAAKTPEQLLAANAGLERVRSRIAAIQARVAAEIEVSDAQKTDGWASPADYLTATAGARRGHGGRVLRMARDLCDELPATLDALHAARISPEHARVIVKTIRRLPIDAELRAAAEKWLLEHAATLIASELETAADQLWETLDPEGYARRAEAALDRLERAAHHNRHFTISEDGHGGVKVRGRGSVEDAAKLKAALAPLSAPQPVDDDPRCGQDGKDHRDHSTRTWDALVALAQKAIDAEVLPESHGVKPRVVITIDYDDLLAGAGTGTLTTGERISAAAVRRLCCDAELIPGVLGAKGEILDVGKAKRLVSAAIFTALVLRDKHCAFPGCRRPPIACDAHHIVSWLDGGPTSMDNTVLLC